MITPLQAIAELDDLVLDLPRFEQALHQFAAKLRLDLAAFTADHISLRCHQNTTAERWRQGLDAVRFTAVRVDDQRPTYLSV
jgi:predicted metalloenzyme YecM